MPALPLLNIFAHLIFANLADSRICAKIKCLRNLSVIHYGPCTHFCAVSSKSANFPGFCGRFHFYRSDYSVFYCVRSPSTSYLLCESQSWVNPDNGLCCTDSNIFKRVLFNGHGISHIGTYWYKLVLLIVTNSRFQTALICWFKVGYTFHIFWQICPPLCKGMSLNTYLFFIRVCVCVFVTFPKRHPLCYGFHDLENKAQLEERQTCKKNENKFEQEF